MTKNNPPQINRKKICIGVQYSGGWGIFVV